MTVLYLIVMLVAPHGDVKNDVFFTFKKADAEKAVVAGARVWKIYPSLTVLELKKLPVKK